MKCIIIILLVSLFFHSCSVEQFAYNTNVEPFAYGGRLFGEKTKGKTIKKSRMIYVLGINCSDIETDRMAELINATSYTVETKHNLASYLIFGLTAGIVNHRVVKVIKR